jgi:hypothetical protein
LTQFNRRNFLQTTALGLAGISSWPRASVAGPFLQTSSTRPASGGLAGERLRGITVDAARLPERYSYYTRLIDFCQEWNLNALLFRLTDDQGSMLRFKSHPELMTHPHALTPEQAHSLALYGDHRGVMVIPEVESFGHTGYITSVAKFAHLQDRATAGEKEFNGLIPVNPESVAVMGDLYREVASIFTAPYLHGGCDEVNWGGSAMSQSALRTKSRAAIWADYLNSLDAVAHRLGKQLIVWGDFVLHKEPGILPRLNKRVIVMDWQYYVTQPQPLAEAAQAVIAQGMRVIGAPAIINCEWGPRIGSLQLQNLDAYADAYAGIRDPQCLGVIVTNWTPSRYLQGSIWDSLGYAATALNQGSAGAHASAFRSFVERFYAAAWGPEWEQVFQTYYRITPNRHSCARNWQGPKLPVPWTSDAELQATLRAGSVEAPPFQALRASLLAVENSVRRNLDSFSSFALSAEYLEYAFWRDSALTGAQLPLSASSSRNLIQTIAQRDQNLLAKLDAEWNQGRFSDSQARHAKVVDLGPADQLLFTFYRAARYSSNLAKDFNRFKSLLIV